MKKKRFTILIGIMISIVSSYAQEQIMELDLQADQNKGVIFVPRLSIGTASNSYSRSFFTDSYAYQYEYPLAYYYSTVDTRFYSTESFMASLDLILSKRIAVSVDLGAVFLRQNVYVSNTEYCHKKCAVVSFVPQFKFYYLARPVVRLYGSTGIGFTKYLGNYDYYSTYRKLEIAGQFSPFGIEVGKTFLGFAEIGVGSLYTGVRLGIGYRF